MNVRKPGGRTECAVGGGELPAVLHQRVRTAQPEYKRVEYDPRKPYHWIFRGSARGCSNAYGAVDAVTLPSSQKRHRGRCRTSERAAVEIFDTGCVHLSYEELSPRALE